MYSTADNGNPQPDERLTQMSEDQGANLTQVGEIEVTEEMASEGASEYLFGGWDPEMDPADEIVRAIYCRMEKARTRSPSHT